MTIIETADNGNVNSGNTVKGLLFCGAVNLAIDGWFFDTRVYDKLVWLSFILPIGPKLYERHWFAPSTWIIFSRCTITKAEEWVFEYILIRIIQINENFMLFSIKFIMKAIINTEITYSIFWSLSILYMYILPIK